MRYRRLVSLEEYWLVSQDKSQVGQHVRQEDGTWKFTSAERLEAASVVTVLGVTLSLAEVCDKITFDKITFEGNVSVMDTAGAENA